MSRGRHGRGWLGAVVLSASACVGFPPPYAGEQGSSSGSSTTEPFDPTLPGPGTTSGAEPMTSSSSSDGGESSTSSSGTTEADDLSCCEAHASPGCDDEGVLACVCEQSPECCDQAWDDTCVVQAVRSCGADCGDPPTTGEDAGPVGACVGQVEFEMLPTDAIITGAWSLMLSELGEGEIAVHDETGRTGGSVLFTPVIPCDDTFYLWVRFWEQDDADSYFVQIDGEPDPLAIFEADCSPSGDGWGWAQLNWRDQNEPLCNYIEDPWAPMWDAGDHTVEFTFRESMAVGRVVVTNDPMFVPE
ncbi:MAG: hypothetical protein AAF799_42935 [Myxococcota bacterium]